MNKDLLCGLVGVGLSRVRAARHVGISRSTFYRLLKREPEFASRLRQSEMQGEVLPLRQIINHGKTNWRAAAWVLERTMPDLYGRRAPFTVTHGDLMAILLAQAKLYLSDLAQTEYFDKVAERLRQLNDLLRPSYKQSSNARRAMKELDELCPPGQNGPIAKD